MDVELTKDQEKLLTLIYKKYLESVKSGESKTTSARFESVEYKTWPKLEKWNKQDLSFTLADLGKMKLINLYMGGDFNLTDRGTYYMENRFKSGLVEVTDFITKFIP